MTGIFDKLRQKAKQVVCNLPFENQLFGYTCNFHRKFRFIFSLHLSEIAQNVHFRKAQFQNFLGEHAPEPPRVLDTIFAGITLNCFRVTCYYQWIILSIILLILRTLKDVSFLSRKGCTFRIKQILHSVFRYKMIKPQFLKICIRVRLFKDQLILILDYVLTKPIELT